jgi:uncharacterized protein YlxW (UPF0749 family)
MEVRKPRLRRLGWLATVALTALVLGFFFATQLRSQLIPPSAQVARNQALLAAVQSLERENAGYRDRVATDRKEIAALEAAASGRTTASSQLAAQVADLRAHAGLTPLRGPGEVVSLGNGKPNPSAVTNTSYLVDFQDLQDVVNVLFQGGAEAVAVNGRRISPASRWAGEGSAVVIDQGPPLQAPFNVTAIGNRGEMETLLGEPASLGDLKARQRDFQLQMTWQGSGELAVPAYDSSLDVTYASGG